MRCISRRATLASVAILALCLLLNGGWIFAKAKLAQVLIEHAWDTSDSNQIQLPWGWADTWPVARIRAPNLINDLYVLAGAQGSSLAFGPGHVSSSVLPGEQGFSVVGGHRDTHFNFLQHLQLNDKLEVQTLAGTKFTYQVRAIDIANVALSPQLYAPTGSSKKQYLALVTCYPFNGLSSGGDLRYVVTLEAVGTRRPLSI